MKQMTLSFYVLILAVSSIAAVSFNMPQPEVQRWLSHESVTTGPVPYKTLFAYASGNTMTFMDRNGTVHNRIEVGRSITTPIEHTEVNGSRALRFATPSKGFIATDRGIQYDIRRRNATIYAPPAIVNTSKGRRTVLSVNYPQVSRLNGTVIWERPQKEMRSFHLLDANADDISDIVGGVSRIVALTIDGNVHWSFDMQLRQPLATVQVDSDAATELLAMGANHIRAFETNGKRLWAQPADNVWRTQPVVADTPDGVAVATRQRMFHMTNDGTVTVNRSTSIAYPKQIIYGQLTKGLNGYIVADDSTITALTRNTTLWQYTFDGTVHNILAADVTADGSHELVVGTEKGIAVLDSASITIQPVFSMPSSNVQAGDAVTFDASRSRPANAQFRWDVNGDGRFDTDWQPSPTYTHRYFATGTYTVTLAMQHAGQQRQTQRTIQVIDPDTPPRLNVTTIQKDGDTVQFIAHHLARGHANLSFRFDIDNDGTYERKWSTQPLFTANNVTEGTHRVAVEAKTADGTRVTASTAYSVTADSDTSTPEAAGGTLTPFVIGGIALIILVLAGFILYQVRQQRTEPRRY